MRLRRWNWSDRRSGAERPWYLRLETDRLLDGVSLVGMTNLSVHMKSRADFGMEMYRAGTIYSRQ